MDAAKNTPRPHEVLADYRDKIMPGCDLAIVDEFLERYLAAVDADRTEALRLERLHDAAQELLETLKACLDSLEFVRQVAPNLIGWGVRDERINAARATIAKATKEQGQ